jgi:polysaccharide export outer membrane protein
MIRRFIALLFCGCTIAAVGSAQQLQSRTRYQIHSGDQLTLEYTYTPEFNETATVQPDGYITMKVGKDVAIAGLTLDEAKVLVEKSAAERLQNPVVVLTLTDFQKPYFVVAGEAFAPLKYDMRENLTVLQGLMLAGGIKSTGKETQVVLIHGLGTASPDIHLLDLKHVESKKILEQDMALRSGDIIFIPRNKLTKAIQVMSLLTAPVGYANAAIYATH